MKKKIFINLKRFDILKSNHGVNYSENVFDWGSHMVKELDGFLKNTSIYQKVDIVVYFPEAHIIPAIMEKKKINSILEIGCQAVYKEDVGLNGNFGAFTSHRPASSMKQLGISHTIIGHFEERLSKRELLAVGNSKEFSAVDRVLNEEIKMAQKQGMEVLFCIGENADERSNWRDVLGEQLKIGLSGADKKKISIAYEPIWAIGPGKKAATKDEIEEVVMFIKEMQPDIAVVYGGGLKKENVKTIAQVNNLDGGLVALTRFSGDIGFFVKDFSEIIEEYCDYFN